MRTLLQSGNVLFRSGLTDRRQLVKRIMQEIERQLDLEVEVILRTLAEVASIVERGPVLSPRADKSKLLVMFLSVRARRRGASRAAANGTRARR